MSLNHHEQGRYWLYDLNVPEVAEMYDELDAIGDPGWDLGILFKLWK